MYEKFVEEAYSNYSYECWHGIKFAALGVRNEIQYQAGVDRLNYEFKLQPNIDDNKVSWSFVTLAVLEVLTLQFSGGLQELPAPPPQHHPAFRSTDHLQQSQRWTVCEVLRYWWCLVRICRNFFLSLRTKSPILRVFPPKTPKYLTNYQFFHKNLHF